MKLDYSDQYAFYAYDADGRMYSDSGRGIRGIDYSWANKPRRIDMSTTSGIFQQDNTSMYCNHYADGVRESNDLVIMNEFTQTSQYTYYADSFVFDGRGQNGKPGLFSRLLLPWGYVDRGRKVYTYIHDYQGNIRAVVDSAGVAVQTTDYYPYGAPMATSTGANVNPYKYSGKEYETRKGLNQYDFHARNQLPTLGLFDQPDPLADKHPDLSPYIYCNANPINFVDYNGMDTINVSYVDDKWNIDNTVVAEGDDVFIVKRGESTQTYVFDEGEYGKRVCAVNLEIGEEGGETFGIYHVSGQADEGTGFYVSPGGDPSTGVGSGRRIPVGNYPLNAPHKDAQWQAVGVGGSVASRGVRFHYGMDRAIGWTTACFVLFYDYTRINELTNINLESSLTAYKNFSTMLGAESFIPECIYIKSEHRTKVRLAGIYPNPVTHRFFLK